MPKRPGWPRRLDPAGGGRLVLAGLLALLGLEAWAAERPPVRLALVVPLSGAFAPAGEAVRRGAELALADRGGRLDRRVELLVRDDQLDPRQAAGVARRLVEEGAWGTVGHFYSSSSIAASAIYAEAGILQIAPLASHPRLTSQGYGTVFRLAGRDDRQAEPAAAFALERLERRRLALVHDRTEHGRRLAEAFRLAVETRRPGGVVLAEAITQGETRFERLVERLRRASADLIYFGGLAREAGRLLRQVREGGLTAPFLAGEAVQDPEFLALAGEAALTGAYLTALPDPGSLPSARGFRERYRAVHGTVPSQAASGYDAMGAMLFGLAEARPAAGTPEALRSVAELLRARGYPGALGSLRWDENGDRTPVPYVVHRVRERDGGSARFEPLGPTDPAPRATGGGG